MIPQINQIVLGMFLTYSKELYYVVDKIEDEEENPVYYVENKGGYALSPDEGIYIPNVYKWEYMEELVEKYADLFTRVELGCWTLSTVMFPPKFMFIDDGISSSKTEHWIKQQGRNLSTAAQVRFILNN